MVTAVPSSLTFSVPAEEMQEFPTVPSQLSLVFLLPLLKAATKDMCGGVMAFDGCASMAPAPGMLSQDASSILAVNIAATALSAGKPVGWGDSLMSSPPHRESTRMAVDEDFCCHRVVTAAAFTSNFTLLPGQTRSKGAARSCLPGVSGTRSTIREFASSAEFVGGDGSCSSGAVDGATSGVDDSERRSRSGGGGIFILVGHDLPIRRAAGAVLRH